MRFIVYNTDGNVLRTGNCPPNSIKLQALESETVVAITHSKDESDVFSKLKHNIKTHIEIESLDYEKYRINENKNGSLKFIKRPDSDFELPIIPPNPDPIIYISQSEYDSILNRLILLENKLETN